jgi:DNA repair photolyase
MIVPVIHCLNWHQIKTNLETCRKNGVEMVFLINHRPGPDSAIDLEKWFSQAKSEFPEIKIGINFLQLNTEDSIDSCNRIGSDAIWTEQESETLPCSDRWHLSTRNTFPTTNWDLSVWKP